MLFDYKVILYIWELQMCVACLSLVCAIASPQEAAETPDIWGFFNRKCYINAKASQ